MVVEREKQCYAARGRTERSKVEIGRQFCDDVLGALEFWRLAPTPILRRRVVVEAGPAQVTYRVTPSADTSPYPRSATQMPVFSGSPWHTHSPFEFPIGVRRWIE